jgi:hypothetical protein
MSPDKFHPDFDVRPGAPVSKAIRAAPAEALTAALIPAG